MEHEKIVLVSGGVLSVALIGYILYRRSIAASAAVQANLDATTMDTSGVDVSSLGISNLPNIMSATYTPSDSSGAGDAPSQDPFLTSILDGILGNQHNGSGSGTSSTDTPDSGTVLAPIITAPTPVQYPVTPAVTYYRSDTPFQVVDSHAGVVGSQLQVPVTNDAGTSNFSVTNIGAPIISSGRIGITLGGSGMPTPVSGRVN